jgi:hypothetical protein
MMLFDGLDDKTARRVGTIIGTVAGLLLGYRQLLTDSLSL